MPCIVGIFGISSWRLEKLVELCLELNNLRSGSRVLDCTLGGTDNIRGTPTVTVGPDNKVECMLCQCFLEAAEHTTLHMVTHGIGTIVCRCRVCGQQGDLSYFQQTGESEGLIFCHTCFLASNKAKRQNNVGHTSNLRLHVCNICSKGFQLRGHLTRHKLIHSGAKPYLCEVCGKGFSQKSSLKLHKQSHAGMNPHTCHQCGQKFRFKVSLLSHILSLHGTSGGDEHFFKNKVSKLPHTCDVCGRKFATLYKIRRHYRSHTKDRPYKCDRCGRLFSQSGNLNLHKKKHEDDGNVTTQTFDVPLLVQFMPQTNRDGVMHPKCTEVVLSHQLSTLEPSLLSSSAKNQDHTTQFDPSLRPQFEQTSSEYMVSVEGTIKDKNTDTELFSPFSHDGLLFIDEGAVGPPWVYYAPGTLVRWYSHRFLDHQSPGSSGDPVEMGIHHLGSLLAPQALLMLFQEIVRNRHFTSILLSMVSSTVSQRTYQ
ncbi:unnamed protein product [Timema podura]|uniref:C2H2-type domain-containing protein n=1 Tax=Timema podura TaxID=61482 RepID=A0ABN7P5R2_TIMPD|nr:unnamed protein product [Timema podura]